MDIQLLRKYWQDNGEKLYTYSPAQVDKSKFDSEAFIFLTTCGLPCDAAPFLSFSEIKEGKLLTPNQRFKIDFDGLGDYLMFGSNGSGDPICIDTIDKSQIIYLNHDSYFEKVFINSSCIVLKIVDSFMILILRQVYDLFLVLSLVYFSKLML